MRVLWLPVTLASAIWLAFQVPDGKPRPTPEVMTVTSDTAAWCTRLAAQMQQAADPPEEALGLWDDGVRLCRHGDVRAGIDRLRRALLLTGRDAAF